MTKTLSNNLAILASTSIAFIGTIEKQASDDAEIEALAVQLLNVLENFDVELVYKKMNRLQLDGSKFKRDW